MQKLSAGPAYELNWTVGQPLAEVHLDPAAPHFTVQLCPSFKSCSDCSTTYITVTAEEMAREG